MLIDMNVRQFFITVALLSQVETKAQGSLSLHDCIKENYQVKLTVVNARIVAEAKKGSSYLFLPFISLSNQHNLSTGRVLDPTTYQFITNRTVFDMSASVGGSVTLFAGSVRHPANPSLFDRD